MKQGIFVQFLRFFLKFSKIFTKKIRFQKHLFHSVSNLTVFEMYVMLTNAQEGAQAPPCVIHH